jgi:hypothetical protein
VFSSARSKLLAPVLVALVILLAGCGGGGGAAGTSSQVRDASAHQSRSTGDRSIQTWGEKASPTQWRSAVAAVRAYLDARAEHAWGAACGLLDQKLRAEVSQMATGAGCARMMADLGSRASVAELRREADIEPTRVRIGAQNSFLVYRRSDGTYAMPLVRRANGWSLDLMTPSQIE